MEPANDPLVDAMLAPMRELLKRYQRLAVKLNETIASVQETLGELPAQETAPRPQVAMVATPTGDLPTLLEFQERLSELDGVLRVTVAGSTPGRSSFIVELASAEPELRNRVVCSNCGKVISEGSDPPSHSLCEDCGRFPAG